MINQSGDRGPTQPQHTRMAPSNAVNAPARRGRQQRVGRRRAGWHTELSRDGCPAAPGADPARRPDCAKARHKTPWQEGPAGCASVPAAAGTDTAGAAGGEQRRPARPGRPGRPERPGRLRSARPERGDRTVEAVMHGRRYHGIGGVTNPASNDIPLPASQRHFTHGTHRTAGRPDRGQARSVADQHQEPAGQTHRRQTPAARGPRADLGGW